MSSRPNRRFGTWTALLLVALLAASIDCAGPLRHEELRAHDAPLVVDDDLELAQRYAPVVYHAVHPTKGRQDIPTRVDFDGDLRGDNNWESFPRYELPPTVYYAVLRTATHLFLTYHVFHPRDWSHVRLGVHLTHENDGENLQVVVDRATGEVVLLFTQAHYVGGVYAGGQGRAAVFRDGEQDIRGPMLLIDDQGRPAADGTHAGVFVESHGHGIYGVLDDCAEVVVATDGTARFETAGIVFLPAPLGDAVHEPGTERVGATGATSTYQLESTTAKLWSGLLDGSLVGEGGLLDGALPYESPVIRIDVPRYYEADRFSGPFGPDRGIAPFAVDFAFGKGQVGALFFDPARRYAETLHVPLPWSTDYEDYPFTR